MEKSVQYPRFRWIILGAILITTMCSSMILISIAPLVGVVAKDLGIDLGTASFGFMGLHFLATALGCVISGFIIDKVGLFRVLIISLIGLAAANASIPLFAYSFDGMTIIRVIEGLFCAPIIVAIGPVVAEWFPVNEKGIANGLQSVAISVGIAAGLIASPALVEAVGNWRGGVAWLSAVPVASLLIVLWITLSPHPQPPTQTKDSGNSSIDEGKYFKQALRKVGFWTGALCYCFGLWTQQAFNDLTPGYFAVEQPIGVGLGPMQAGQLMSTVMLAGIVGSLLVGFIIAKCKGNTRPAIMLGFVLLAIGCTSVMFSAVYGNSPILLVCLIMAGVGTAFVNPSAMTFAASSFPPAIVGRVVGIYAGMGLFTGSIAVMIGAGALHATGNYHMSIAIVGVASVVGFIVSVFLKKPNFMEARSEKISPPKVSLTDIH